MWSCRKKQATKPATQIVNFNLQFTKSLKSLFVWVNLESHPVQDAWSRKHKIRNDFNLLWFVTRWIAPSGASSSCAQSKGKIKGSFRNQCEVTDSKVCEPSGALKGSRLPWLLLASSSQSIAIAKWSSRWNVPPVWKYIFMFPSVQKLTMKIKERKKHTERRKIFHWRVNAALL